MSVRVLLRFPHGLGDVVQFTVILKHLRKLRPDWVVDVRCGRGKHSALLGLCNRVFHDQEQEPAGPYDSIADIGWFENYCRYSDRPNSKITNCLQEVFGLQYEPSLGRYEVQLPATARQKAASYLRSIGCTAQGEKHNSVIIHYEGNTSPGKKNVAHWQAQLLIDTIKRCDRIPVILDWDNRSPLPDNQTIFKPDCGQGDIWGGFGSGDAQTIAALIHCSEAFIGIDSGPGKCASATATPSLLLWKGHHPVQFHDPADNTTHLIPHDWMRIPPCSDVPAIGAYFLEHYRHRTYHGEHGLVSEAENWLLETLSCPEKRREVGHTFVLPNGIGDVIWALLKLRSVAKDRPIDIALAGDPRREIDQRSLPFLKRFGFVRSACVLDVPHLEDKENPTDSQGRYRYVPDGVRGDFHYLMPNRPLEEGKRIEEWLPDHPVDWKIMDQFSWGNTERGSEMGDSIDPFVAFYLGPEGGHCDEGHNWKWLWEPKHWVELGHRLQERGLNIAVVGAPYDRSFWEKYVREGVEQAGMNWLDLIGRFEIGETLALLKKSKVLVSYQCGLGIVTHYLGGNVIMWWRQEGNSAHPKRLVSFSEKMKDAWTNPAFKDRYYGAIYQRETVGDLLAEMDRRGWLQ